MAGITPAKVNVHLNKSKLTDAKDFESYVKLYLDSTDTQLFKEKNKRWEVIIAPSNGTFN